MHTYGPQGPCRESFGEYIAKMDKNFARLRKEGVDLPESAQGYILYRHLVSSKGNVFWCGPMESMTGCP